MNPKLLGFICTLGAFICWGLLPIYWKSLSSIDPMQLLAHRVVWAAPFLCGLLSLQGEWSDFRAIFKSRKTLLTMLATTVLIAINWFTYVYAIVNDQMLQASLGYFINPLLAVALGATFLGERMRPLQWMAAGIVACSVLYLALQGSGTPWLALLLACSFAFYSLIRKTVSVGSVPALTLEVLILTTPALAYLIMEGVAGRGVFGAQALHFDILLALAGPFTAIPLMLFGWGVRRVTLTLVGFLQYLTPSSVFLLGVFVYGEPLEPARLTTFICIWIALVIFTGEGLFHVNRTRRNAAQATA